MDGIVIEIAQKRIYGWRRVHTAKMGSRFVQSGANKRSVWTVTTKPYSEAHFATYPPDLIEPCILDVLNMVQS